MRRATPDAPPRVGVPRLAGYSLVGNLPGMLREPLKKPPSAILATWCGLTSGRRASTC